MSVYVFTGPTLAPAEARAELEAVYLPPVKQGDVRRVVLRQPRAIGIIDGYFQGVPAVWHKEILWAMAQGIHVFGSASMGALRAAELAQFGMVGVGRIFEAYRNGTLEDDDEVAVIHGQAGTGYAAVSEALVNIRYTLLQAEQLGVISAATRDALIDRGKQLFHYQRSYERLLQEATEQGLPAVELAALSAWLPAGKINQKRLDARAMLATMREFLATDPPRKQVSYRFEPTSVWEKISIPALPVTLNAADDGEWLPLDSLLDELRLAGNPALDTQREAQLHALAALGDPVFDAHLIEHLRAICDYPRLFARALDKQAVLTARGILQPTLDELPLDRTALITWYFEQRLGQSIPQDVDEYSRYLGFASSSDFYRALAGEYLYLANKSCYT
jgi:hypothetical protein